MSQIFTKPSSHWPIWATLDADVQDSVDLDGFLSQFGLKCMIFSSLSLKNIHKKGESPYRRETYRYTPILAYLMLPNPAVHESFGKLVFIVFDLLAAYLVLLINRLDSSSTQRADIVALEFALFNPITLAISSRGNAESVMACLVLSFIYFLKRRAFIPAGILYGLAIHFKIYPITYGLVVLFYLIRLDRIRFNLESIKSRILLNFGLYKFGCASVSTLVSLTLLFYQK